jgi:hypothetical protein
VPAKNVGHASRKVRLLDFSNNSALLENGWQSASPEGRPRGNA